MIRAATVADARAIGALQLRAWLRAYEDIVDGSVLAGYDVDGREARWVENLTAAESTTLVAEVGGRVCGFVSVGADRAEDTDPATGEIWALHVDPPAQGAGQGGELLSSGETQLRQSGYARAVLRVFRDNGHARGFYEGRGWAFVEGSEREDDWAVEVTYEKTL
jgi:ribosomal protein S18 acetylase RimI-like enzyme